MNENAWKGLVAKSLVDKGFSKRKVKEILSYLEKLLTIMSEAELELIYAKD